MGVQVPLLAQRNPLETRGSLLSVCGFPVLPWERVQEFCTGSWTGAAPSTIRAARRRYYQCGRCRPSPPCQQDRIVDVLQGIEHRLSVEEELLACQRSTESALMSVLLTGKVRVRVDEEAAA
jgi:hypothetical protein